MLNSGRHRTVPTVWWPYAEKFSQSLAYSIEQYVKETNVICSNGKQISGSRRVSVSTSYKGRYRIPWSDCECSLFVKKLNIQLLHYLETAFLCVLRFWGGAGQDRRANCGECMDVQFIRKNREKPSLVVRAGDQEDTKRVTGSRSLYIGFGGQSMCENAGSSMAAVALMLLCQVSYQQWISSVLWLLPF